MGNDEQERDFIALRKCKTFYMRTISSTEGIEEIEEINAKMIKDYGNIQEEKDGK